MISRKRQINRIKQIGSLLVVMWLATACPATKKMEEIIERSESQKVTDQYRTVLKKAYPSNRSKLELISVYGEDPSNYTIELVRDEWERRWLVHLLQFQERLEEENLDYFHIHVFAKKGITFLFEKDNLRSYKKAHDLFRKNLKSIENGKISNLKEIINPDLNWKAVEDLFGFDPIDSYTEYELMNYSDYASFDDLNSIHSSVDSVDDVIFKIRTKSGAWIYFNYRVEKKITLRSVDLKQE